MRKYILTFPVACALIISCTKSHNGNPPLPPRPTGYLISKITDDNGRLVVQYQYDALNHLIKMDFYDVSSFNKHTATIYTYNSLGLVDTMKVENDSFAAMNYCHVYKYGAEGRVIRKLTAVGGYSPDESSGFDYSYNSLGEVVSSTLDAKSRTDYVYDAAGNAIKEIGNYFDAISGKEKQDIYEYNYDSHPRPSTYLEYLPEGNTFPIQFVPQGGGLAENLSRNNVTLDKAQGITYTYTYNADGYPASVTLASSSGAYTFHFEYIRAN